MIYGNLVSEKDFVCFTCGKPVNSYKNTNNEVCGNMAFKVSDTIHCCSCAYNKIFVEKVWDYEANKK